MYLLQHQAKAEVGWPAKNRRAARSGALSIRSEKAIRTNDTATFACVSMTIRLLGKRQRLLQCAAFYTTQKVTNEKLPR